MEKVTERRGGFLNTLSGRFLMLTVIFVMLAEILIFVPSIARYRADFLLTRLKQAQIAALTQLATEDMIMPELEKELLRNAEVFNVVLRRDDVRRLVLSSPLPQEVHESFDLRMAGPWELIRDAFRCLVDPENRIVRVIGNPVQDGGTLIEITMETRPLRDAMLDYGLRILLLSALISVVTGFLLFLAVRRLLVMPIRRSEASYSARRAPSSWRMNVRAADD